jgi:hypothetical protein
MKQKAIIILLALFSLYCSSSAQTLRYFKIGFRQMTDSDYMVAATSDNAVISRCLQQISLPVNQKTMHIHGNIAAGTMTNNPYYKWHFVNNEWDVVEVSMELCDIRPTSIVAPIYGGMKIVCPWSSFVLSELSPSEIRSILPAKNIYGSKIVLRSASILVQNNGSVRTSVLSIVNIQGRTIQRAAVNGSQIIETHSLGTGTYLLRNEIDGQDAVVMRFVKP